MDLRRPAASTVAAVMLLAGAGCAGEEAPDASAEPTPADVSSAAGPDEPAGLALGCHGSGSPAVVLEAGLNTSGETFSSLAARVAETTRVCVYDRAGIGTSPALAPTDPDPWPGSSADALAEALATAGEEAPYVMLGWSYGGMVAQAFATRHPDLTAGLVLEDSSVPEQLVDRLWDDIAWEDGGRVVDEKQTIEEVGTVDLGDLPVLVLTQDQLPKRLRTAWSRYQDRLARSSTNAVHVLAAGSPHEIHVAAEDLVLQAVEEVAAPAGGRCL
jgi:pimeloyl-ACP methyl ester carboxylesterase